MYEWPFIDSNTVLQLALAPKTASESLPSLHDGVLGGIPRLLPSFIISLSLRPRYFFTPCAAFFPLPALLGNPDHLTPISAPPFVSSLPALTSRFAAESSTELVCAPRASLSLPAFLWDCSGVRFLREKAVEAVSEAQLSNWT